MIKINMKRLADLEQQNANNKIYLNTLQQMVDMVMMPQDPLGMSNLSAIALAMCTLADLKVIDDPEDRKNKDVTQLNS